MNLVTAQPATSPSAFLCPTGPGGPSFRIRGGESSAAQAFSSLRLDRINSAELLRCCRRVYFRFLEARPSAPEPIGVVLLGAGPQGRVVFELPVLLPEERFVPLDLLRPAWPARQRTSRAVSNRPLP